MKYNYGENIDRQAGGTGNEAAQNEITNRLEEVFKDAGAGEAALELLLERIKKFGMEGLSQNEKDLIRELSSHVSRNKNH
jgi:hypothetical protein